uniref:Peptidase S1 domain-containing protein n=1 Tax=Panagrellus redivivus TaxID=6233 RepID=A0A7E4VE15_PANRE
MLFLIVALTFLLSDSEAENCVKLKPPFVYAFPGGHLNLEDRLVIHTPIAKDNKWLNVSISDQNNMIVYDYLPYLWLNMSSATEIKIELLNTYGIKIFVNDQFHRTEGHPTDDPAADYWKLMCDIDKPVGPFDICIIRNRGYLTTFP